MLNFNWLDDLDLDLLLLKLAWPVKTRIITYIHKFPIGFESLLCFIFMLLVFLIGDHIFRWKKPMEQKIIILIILTPFNISIASYAQLKVIHFDYTFVLLMDSIKQCFVGLAMVLFMKLMYTYLDINNKQLSGRDIRLIIGRRLIRNLYPVTLIQPRYVVLTLRCLKLVKYFTWQFVVIRLLFAVLILALQFHGMYPFWLSCVFSVMINASASLAFYTVYVFHQAYREDFKSHSSVIKFFFIKGLFFICFWQGVVLSVLLLALRIIIKSEDFWVDLPPYIQQVLQNGLVISEMMFFAMFQMIAYSPAPYIAPSYNLLILRPDPKPASAKPASAKPEVEKESLRIRINV